MYPCALLFPALPAGPLAVIGVHSFGWESVITIAARCAGAGQWWRCEGMRGPSARSGRSDEEEDPCLLLGVASW